MTKMQEFKVVNYHPTVYSDNRVPGGMVTNIRDTCLWGRGQRQKKMQEGEGEVEQNLVNTILVCMEMGPEAMTGIQ